MNLQQTIPDPRTDTVLQYSPDLLQWFLLTSSSTVGRGFFLLGVIVFLFILVSMLFPGRLLSARSRKPFEAGATRRSVRGKPSNSILWPGIAALVLMAIGIVPFQFADADALRNSVATEIAETANFTDVKLLQIDTVSNSPIAESAIVYIGTAKDVDGDPRQFRYTQYEKFGVYESIGFEKPAVDLKDETFKSTEKGLEIYKGTAEPDANSTETSAPKSTETPAP